MTYFVLSGCKTLINQSINCLSGVQELKSSSTKMQ